jgi:hypothetical protein
VFTDAWPVAWVNLGATSDGSKFVYDLKVDKIVAAELFDPIAWKTVERSGNISFALMSWTLSNLKTVLNGGALTVVSGTTTTQLNKYEPPAPGTEVRSMIGWESLDATTRIVCYQCLQGGTMETDFKRVPSTALMPAQFNFEIPTSPAVPFSIWTAGVARI